MKNKKIQQYRKIIDKLDKELIKILEKRLVISKSIQKIKKIKTDKSRETEIITNIQKQTKLNKKYIANIYNIIFKYSKLPKPRS